jgi:hypothetical protein
VSAFKNKMVLPKGMDAWMNFECWGIFLNNQYFITLHFFMLAAFCFGLS